MIPRDQNSYSLGGGSFEQKTCWKNVPVAIQLASSIKTWALFVWLCISLVNSWRRLHFLECNDAWNTKQTHYAWCTEQNFPFYLHGAHLLITLYPIKMKKRLKTIWDKEKMLVICIFSFSHNIFYQMKDRNHRLCYIYFVICKCCQFGFVQNFAVR